MQFIHYKGNGTPQNFFNKTFTVDEIITIPYIIIINSGSWEYCTPITPFYSNNRWVDGRGQCYFISLNDPDGKSPIFVGTISTAGFTNDSKTFQLNFSFYNSDYAYFNTTSSYTICICSL